MSIGSIEKQPDPALPGSVPEEQFKQLVEVISRSQHNYRELIDSLDQAVFTFSLDGEVRVANRRLSEILGASFPDLIGHRLNEFVETPTLTDVEHAMPTFLKSGTWTGVVPVRLKKDNCLYYFECWLQAVTDEGQVAGVSGWARDVTAQRNSELLFTEFFESLQEGILITTREGQILDANPALVRMLGYENKDDLRTRNFREFYFDPSQRDTMVREAQAEGSADPSAIPQSLLDREIVLCKRDGQRLYCLASGFAIRDVYGNVVRFHGMLVDVTAHREIERQLRQEQEFIRRLVASFPDLIAVFDREGRFTYASQRVKEIFGGQPEEYIGQRLDELADSEDRPKLAELFRSIMEGEAAHDHVEFRARNFDHSWRTVRVSAGPLADGRGKISGVVASVRDITEARAIYAQLAQKEKFAAMGQMMIGAAHELNNPLTAILGVSELLSERATDDAARRQIDIVVHQSRRAAGIIQDLLAFSRPPAQGRSKIRLDEIVQNALELQQPMLRGKNITVTFQAAEDLPLIDADRKQLTQVFLNIITNAEQAISSASDHGTLRVSIAYMDGKCSIAFADDGPGIPPANLAKIFDPFFTTKRPGGGSGLGLTICLALVKEHGGAMCANSDPGGGATFQVTLPVVRDHHQTPSAGAGPTVTESSGAHSDILAGHQVLIVDDEESIREIIQEGLSARALHVECAENSEQAFACLAQKTYEVVVCDFNLPGLNGEQFFEKVSQRTEGRVPRFVFMTGELVDAARMAELARKGASVLQKPFHVAALAALLADIFQSKTSKVS